MNGMTAAVNLPPDHAFPSSMKTSRHLRICLLVAALWFSVASSATDLKDVPYGDAPALKLDIYRPSDAKDAPIILMVHGGGWRYGDKTTRGVVGHKAERWVSKGFILVSINYRMLPQADVPEQAADVARALAYTQANARSWGGDPDRIILMGHSAGAHLASLLTADPQIAIAQGALPWLGTVSIDTAAIDVPTIMEQRHPALYDRAFGSDPNFWNATSPARVLTSQAMPLLAICSTVRARKPCEQTRKYVQRAREKNVRAELLEQPLNHAQINAQLGLDSNYTRAVEAFMASLDAEVERRLAY